VCGGSGGGGGENHVKCINHKASVRKKHYCFLIQNKTENIP